MDGSPSIAKVLPAIRITRSSSLQEGPLARAEPTHSADPRVNNLGWQSTVHVAILNAPSDDPKATIDVASPLPPARILPSQGKPSSSRTNRLNPPAASFG